MTHHLNRLGLVMVAVLFAAAGSISLQTASADPQSSPSLAKIGCITRVELQGVQAGWTYRQALHHVGAYPRWSRERRDEGKLVYVYNACMAPGVVVIRFDRGAAGAWRVVTKEAVWGY